MIEAKVPKAIDQYETKTVGPLTTRQAISLVIVAVIDFAILSVLSGVMGKEIWELAGNFTVMLALILIDLPAIAVGFIKVYGVPMEKFAMGFFRYSILAPAKRREKTVLYDGIREKTGKKKKKTVTKPAFRQYP